MIHSSVAGTLRTISVDRELAATADSGSVIAVHRRTTVLETIGGDLITLAASALGNGPNAVLIDQRPWTVGTRFTTNGAHGLRFASGPALDWSRARQWSAVDSAPTSPPVIDNSAALLAALSQVALDAGLLPIVLGRSPSSAIQQSLARQVSPLVAALPDPEAARRLIGLGPGATPAGDDLLSGLLLTLHYADCLATDLRAIAQNAHTTVLGRSQLRWAAAGRAREAVLLLLQDLFSRPAPAALSRLESVLHYGATSGADLLAGIVIGLRLAAKSEP